MPKIELGKYGALLRRYLAMAGTSEIANELAYEVSPTLQLEDDPLEWEFLKGNRLMAWSIFVPASVGNFGSTRIRNPVNSGVLAVVTKCWASGGLGPAPANGIIFVTFGAQTADLATVSGTVPRDGRMFPPTGGAVVASFSVAGVGGSQIDSGVHFPAGTSTLEFWNNRRGTVVIPPGFALNVQHGNANADLHATFHWTEKRFQQLELGS